MRRPIALFLLFLHLFSLGGSFLVHAVSVYRSDRFFEKQIGRGLYSIDDLTEVKIPATMPGIADQQRYNRLFGEVRFADAAYNYVDVKMTHDAIYLLCIPNYSTTRLCGQNIIDAKQMARVPVNPKDHVPFDKTFNLGFFNCNFEEYVFSVPAKHLLNAPSCMAVDILQSFIASPGQPPEIA